MATCLKSLSKSPQASCFHSLAPGYPGLFKYRWGDYFLQSWQVLTSNFGRHGGIDLFSPLLTPSVLVTTRISPQIHPA